jgi:flagellar biosynthesis chaperone FliJ
MDVYLFTCEACGANVEDDELICFECEDKERKWNKNAKKAHALRELDGRKTTHRTQKRHTKPRKEVDV